MVTRYNTKLFVLLAAFAAALLPPMAPTVHGQANDTLNLPYYDDFESYADGATVPGWDSYSYGNTAVLVDDFYGAHSGLKGLTFPGNYYTTPTTFRSPAIAATSRGLYVSFWAFVSQTPTYYHTSAGIMTDPNDTTTYIELASIDSLALDQWHFFEFYTASVADSGTVYVAFRKVGYNYMIIDDISIDHASECPPPYGLGATPGYDIAWFNWHHYDDSASFIVTINDGRQFTTTDSSLTIDSLLPEHNYNLSVRAICSTGDTSPAAWTSFVTDCGMLPTPTLYNFENYSFYSTEPNCWLYPMGRDVSGSVQTPVIVSTYQYSKVLEMYNNTKNVIMAATQRVAAVPSTLHVGFDLQASPGGVMEAGVMTDAEDSSTFVPMIVITQEEGAPMQHYDFYGDTLTIEDSVHIAFRWSGHYMRAYLDNVFIEEMNGCHAPSRVMTTEVTATEIAITWEDFSEEHYGYEVCYNTIDTMPTADSMYFTTTDSIYRFLGLDFNRNYWFWVRSLCPYDSTRWLPLGPIRTNCDAESLPYVEGFESYQEREVVQCWSFEHTDTNTAITPIVTNLFPHSGSTSLTQSVANIYSHDTTLMILPRLPVVSTEIHTVFWLAATVNTVFEAGLLKMTDSVFVPYFTLVGGNNYQQTMYEFYSSDTYITDSVRVAFRVSRDTAATATTAIGSIYLDDVRVMRDLPCRHIDSISISNTTDTSISIVIHDPQNNAAYRVYYGIGELTDSMDIYGIRTTIGGLNHSTRYMIAVRNMCYDGSLTEEVSTFARTECMSLTHADLPYIEDFDSYDVNEQLINPCWTLTSSSSNISINIADQALLFITNHINETQYVVLPEIDYLNDLRLSFRLYCGLSSTVVEAGVMTNPYDTTTFTRVSMVPHNQSTNWSDVSLPYDTYLGSGRYIALRIYWPSGSFYNSVGIDNVMVDTIPQCSGSVKNVRAVDVWEQCADVTWSATYTTGTRNSFIVHLLDSTLTEIDSTTTSSTRTGFCDLQPQTKYYAYVEALCNGVNITENVDTICFYTLCEGNVAVNTVNHSVYNRDFTTTTLPLDYRTLYSASEQIFTLDDMGHAGGTISDIMFKQPTMGVIESQYDLCNIYMGHVAYDSLAGWVPFDSLTLVYSGKLYFGDGQTWQGVALHRLFHYNGVQNLIIAMEGYSCQTCLRSNQPSNHSLLTNELWEGVSRYISDPSSDSVTWDSSIVSIYRNILRFSICQEYTDPCPAPVISDLSATDMSITVEYASQNPCEVHITTGWWNHAFTGEVDSTSSHTFTGLQPATEYIIGVRQKCPSEEKSMWVTRRLMTDSVHVYSPDLVVVTDTGLTSATIQWGPQHEDGVWVIHLYNTVMERIDTVGPNEEGMMYHDLTPDVTYYVKIREMFGSDHSIPGPWSEEVSFTTLECLPVSNVRVEIIDSVTVSISWSSEATASAWRIEYGYEGFSRGEAIESIVTTDNPYTLTGLEPWESYQLYVSAMCDHYHSSGWAGSSVFQPAIGVDVVQGYGTPNIVPNPATSRVTIEIDGNNGVSQLTLMDIGGRIVARQQMQGTRCTLEVGNLPRGAYFVNVINDRQKYIGKIILQ